MKIRNCNEGEWRRQGQTDRGLVHDQPSRGRGSPGESTVRQAPYGEMECPVALINKNYGTRLGECQIGQAAFATVTVIHFCDQPV